METPAIAAIPAHVDPAQVVDVDFWRPGAPGADPFLACRGRIFSARRCMPTLATVVA
jgi:hypothetical protein